MIITISGKPGAGKTTVGKAVAARLGLEFYSMGDLRGKMASDRGLTIDELSKRIGAVYETYTGIGLEGYATMRIARTEMIEASNFGNIQAYKQSGVKQMEWITAFDDVTCIVCTGLNGKKSKVGETFAGGYSQPPEPHPNCRCTTAPVIAEE